MKRKHGQVAMEYLILLGLMTIIALTAFRTLLPGAYSETDQHFDVAATNIIGNAVKTGISGPFPFKN